MSNAHPDEPSARRSRTRRSPGHPPPEPRIGRADSPEGLSPESPLHEMLSGHLGELSSTENGSDPSAIDEIRRLDSVLEPCQELLEGALASLNSPAGVLYGVEGPRQLTVLGTVAMTGDDDLPATERAAISALEAHRALLARSPSGQRRTAEYEDPSKGNGRAEILAVPCTVRGEIPAVLVATRPRKGNGNGSSNRGDASDIDADLERLGATLPLALAADRARAHLSLARQMADAEAIRRQLEAYAVDLRSVFLSERARSEELGQALVELEETYESTVRALAIAVEAKDEYTGGHLFRVSRYGMTMTAIVAPDHRDDPQFEYGFLLHDVGKLAVPDAVLVKSGALTEEEWELIRAHPACGRNILECIPFLAGASEIVFCHHERWDGTGFPRGLQGDEIPLGARIFPVADAFDAMTTSRPYRGAIPLPDAREELVRGSGTQFWHDAVEAFMSIPIDELEEIHRGTQGASGW